MKKILTLIGAISIAGSGASTVISCKENNTNNNKTNQGGFNPWDPSSWGEKQKTIFANYYLSSAKVFLINQEITKVDLTVPAGTNPDTTNKDTITAIKTALKTANPILTDGDLKAITLSDVTLGVGDSTRVEATITVGTGDQAATATKDLYVTLPQTNHQKNSNPKTTVDNKTVEWITWSQVPYEDYAVTIAARLVADDAVGNLSKRQGDYVDYDQNQNLIPDNSKNPLSTYLNKGINLYLKAPENKFTIIFIKGDIT